MSNFCSRRKNIRKNPIKFLKTILVSSIYLLLLGAFLNNEFNRHLFGVILDSFWITGITVFYVILLLKINGRQLSEAYFRMWHFEYSSNMYSTIGVSLFKKIVQKYPFPGCTRRIHLEGKSETAIKNLEEQLQEAEETHVFGFLLNIILAFAFGILREISFFLWLTAFNLIMNAYPILLQRYNRNRIRALLQKYALKAKASEYKINAD